MNSDFGFMDLLPTIIVLGIAVVAIYNSTTIVEAVERLFSKKKSNPIKTRSNSVDR